MEPFLELVGALNAAGVRFLLIGVGGANYYAPHGGVQFLTHDRDLFLPAEPENLRLAWVCCERLGYELTAPGEPLDYPRDAWLAERVVERQALTRARRAGSPVIDLTLAMAGFEFESAWKERRSFVDEGVAIPIASLGHIVESKARAGRPKDFVFLDTHLSELRDWFTPAEWLRVAREERKARERSSEESPPTGP